MRNITWPKPLIQELKDKRGLIFLGAGASKSCASNAGERFPDWKQLLETLGQDMTGDDKAAFDDLLEKSRYLDAAQVVADTVHPSTQHDTLGSFFQNKKIKPSSLYESVNLIDQPIVLTTNYDNMYETYWNSLEPDSDDDPQLITADPASKHIVDHLRSGRRLLIKVHGSISNPHDLVLSRSSYAKSRTENAEFYRVVSSLMLTRTMLFIGCGFGGDPDIDLLLEDAAFNAQSNYPHYALIPEGMHRSQISALRNAFNIQAIEYEVRGNDHSDLLAHLSELATIVSD